jgi:hypothetical protein
MYVPCLSGLYYGVSSEIVGKLEGFLSASFGLCTNYNEVYASGHGVMVLAGTKLQISEVCFGS